MTKPFIVYANASPAKTSPGTKFGGGTKEICKKGTKKGGS